VDGSCMSCHQPHSSDHAKLLKESCSNCHAALTANQPKIHEAMTMAKGCSNCHNPHDSNIKLLTKTSVALCLDCHNDSLASNPLPAKVTSSHTLINSEGSCWSCHTPHASADKNLLKPKTTCLGCHDKEIQVTGRKIPNMKDKLENSVGSHSQFGYECGECHKPHASEFVRLLKDNYSVGPYGEYVEGDANKPNTYASCFKCHETALVKSQISGSETGFRKDTKNGVVIERLNLHAVHVANTKGTTGKPFGRSCSVCHDVHGTSQDHMVKPATGAVGLKLVFKSTGKGGNCTTACHGAQPIVYERID